MVARRAHNPKVVGSSPASATKKSNSPFGVLDFFLLYRMIFNLQFRVMKSTSVARWVRLRAHPMGDTASKTKRSGQSS